MKKLKYLLFGAGSIVLTAAPIITNSCYSEKTAEAPKVKTYTEDEVAKKIKAAQTLIENGGGIGSSNAWNSFSGEKHAMGLQVYKNAKVAFDKMITQPNVDLTKVNISGDQIVVSAPEEGKFIPVVFMDLDETVLNNFKYQNYLFLNNQSYDARAWDDFVSQAISTEVPGAIDFIKHVYSKGGVVFFNSNRSQKYHKEPSKTNLINLGLDAKYMPDFVWWMQGVDLSNKEKPYSAITTTRSEKEERMHLVNNNKITIDKTPVQFKVVMRVGDDISDFNDNFTKKPGVTSEQVINELKSDSNRYGDLFGNMDISVKGTYYNKEKGVWEDETHSESYVLIPGNSSYGSWLTHLINQRSYNYAKIAEKLKGFIYVPSKS
ncbi:HAD family acid phosphatase [Mycoplasma sp. 888]|uniref:HAD family acid phosphatase n=1 Tax=Mycoplasma sp. 888 TaxID=3108483 RepID=UPI002D77C8CF|nr:HAD family acid phosphatase [Mycoplasma sp. 888]WRQ25797.1 HAD family acid phosphatase [Mycoplasma sp. 888]